MPETTPEDGPHGDAVSATRTAGTEAPSPGPLPAIPLLTASLPGIGGRVRSRDEDFVVEEIPAYDPSGAGDHLYLLVEKRGITTNAAVDRIARALGRAPRDVGFAGQKDAHAVALQTLSVEHAKEADAERLLAGIPGIRLLRIGRHGNKLRLGHLRGNRFTIRVRGCAAGAGAAAGAILEELVRRGCPNAFGEQRFGMRGDNHRVGRALVRGDAQGALDLLLGGASAPDPADTAPPPDRDGPDGAGSGDGAASEDDDAGSGSGGVPAAPDASPVDPRTRDERVRTARAEYARGAYAAARDALPNAFREERRLLDELARGRAPDRALAALPRPALRFLVSAYQSALFNRLVADRFPDPGAFEEGDLAFLHDRGAVFRTGGGAELDAVRERGARFEVSPSAPLFGTKVLLADGRPGERERALLASEGVTLASFRVRGAGDLDGERRPVRIPVQDASAEELPDGDGTVSVVLRFALPRGSFATTVLAEVRKTAPGTR